MHGQIITDFDNIIQKASEGISLTELIKGLDEQLTYGGARKISKFEAELLDELDKSCDSQIVMQRNIKMAERTSESATETLRKNDDAINEYCSETTKNKIFLNRGYQYPCEEEKRIIEAPSDKEEIDILKKENDALRAENTDLKGRFMRIRTFITRRCARIPILGKRIIKEMNNELGEKQLSQPISIDEK